MCDVCACAGGSGLLGEGKVLHDTVCGYTAGLSVPYVLHAVCFCIALLPAAVGTCSLPDSAPYVSTQPVLQ